jgi:Domain of unknown function (DUF1893).
MEKLSSEHSLEIIKDGETIYFSSGKWLMPLFDAAIFLRGRSDTASLKLHDRIQGRAAAAITVAIGFRTVEVDLISERALSLYEMEGGVDVSFLEKTEKIECMTETLITDEMSVTEVVSMIEKRAGRSLT